MGRLDRDESVKGRADSHGKKPLSPIALHSPGGSFGGCSFPNYWISPPAICPSPSICAMKPLMLRNGEKAGAEAD
ncbi:hypothetical protein GPALN_007946 [Globodera pallida]|nr:hypothetical protein GPALN_007946 [Globodera pallida]